MINLMKSKRMAGDVDSVDGCLYKRSGFLTRVNEESRGRKGRGKEEGPVGSTTEVLGIQCRVICTENEYDAV